MTVVTAVAVAGCSGSGPVGGGDAAISPAIAYTQWKTASRQSVTVQKPYDGTVVASSTDTVSSTAAGTVTTIAKVGAQLAAGDTLLGVDAIPVVAMPGSTPVYRDLLAPTDGTVLRGSDVQQLQAFLASTGDFTGKGDGTFSARLGSAAKAWRTKHAMTAEPGFARTELAFIPGPPPWTVIKADVTSGQAFAGGPVLDVSDGAPAVTVTLDGPPPADATYAAVSLPGQDTPEIPVVPTGPAITADSGGYSQLLAVTMLPTGVNLALGTSVVVEQRETLAMNVVTIPVAAVRLDAAGHTVVACRKDSSATLDTCPVTLGATNGTVVEVKTGVEAGTQVAVAP